MLAYINYSLCVAKKSVFRLINAMLRLRSFAIENNGEQTADRCPISRVEKIGSTIVFVEKNRVTDNEILTHPNSSLTE